MEEEFDYGSNSSSEEKSEYSLSVVIVNDDRSRKESAGNETIFSI